MKYQIEPLPAGWWRKRAKEYLTALVGAGIFLVGIAVWNNPTFQKWTAIAVFVWMLYWVSDIRKWTHILCRAWWEDWRTERLARHRRIVHGHPVNGRLDDA